MKKVFVFPHNRTILAVIVLIALLFTTYPVKSDEGKDILHAGTAKIDITPEKPVKMAEKIYLMGFTTHYPRE